MWLTFPNELKHQFSEMSSSQQNILDYLVLCSYIQGDFLHEKDLFIITTIFWLIWLKL